MGNLNVRSLVGAHLEVKSDLETTNVVFFVGGGFIFEPYLYYFLVFFYSYSFSFFPFKKNK